MVDYTADKAHTPPPPLPETEWEADRPLREMVGRWRRNRQAAARRHPPLENGVRDPWAEADR